MKTLRISLILIFTAINFFVKAETKVPLSFDPNVLKDEIMARFKEDLTSKIDEQLKVAEGYVLDQSLIREMLVPYQDYGINPNDGEYYKVIHGIYTSIKTDPDYDPAAQLKDKIYEMINTRISNYATSFIDKESQAIYTQLKGLFDDANAKITGILEAAERIHNLPPDDPEIETKWANALRKLGIQGELPDLIGDFENIFGQVQARYEKPIAMVSMIRDGLSTKDPTAKIEILFEFGEKFGEDLPIVGSLVSNLFKLGKEVLAAAKRAGGLLERNLGQGCISSDGEYVQKAAIKQSFYESFPHIERACPLSQSKGAGIYQNIYFNTSNASELLFYHKNHWLGSKRACSDGTHRGDSDLRGIRIFLNSKGEKSKSEDLGFLHSAYIKAPGFMHYREQLTKKISEIRSLSTQVYSTLSYCDDQQVEHFMMNTLGLNWLQKLLKKGNGFDFGSVKAFSNETLEDLVDQMLVNRYLSRNHANLDRLDEIIDKLKNNIPVTIYGGVNNKISRQPLSGAKITPDIPLLFENASCTKNSTGDDGNFSFLLAVPLAYEGKLGFTATHRGLSETLEIPVNIQKSRNYAVNFLLESDMEQLEELIITPSTTTLEIGQSVDFSVTAQYKDTRKVDVTSQALEFSKFTAHYEGEFVITANFLDRNVSATVHVIRNHPAEKDTSDCNPSTERWNEELKTCECLPPFLKNSLGECVDPEELGKELGEDSSECSTLNDELVLLIEASRQLKDTYLDNHWTFQLHHDRFMKEINDQAADVCENQMIGYTYYHASNAANRMKTLEDDLVNLLIDIAYNITVCPEQQEMLEQNGISADVTQWVDFYDIAQQMAVMTDRLSEFGCNTDDVAQNGESVAPGQSDPTFVGKGGSSTEIAGDGKDNDGDGLQDEIPVAGLPGYNITIALYDSGDAKDDVFNLSVEGLGSLGLTPAGGLRTYGLNLPPGTYSADVLVVVAPDDFGTFTINILQDGISIGSLTGRPGEGSVSTVVFEVTE